MTATNILVRRIEVYFWPVCGLHILKEQGHKTTLFTKFQAHLHPEETSKNSDNCDFLKVSDIGKSIVVNGETYILNDTAQFSEDMSKIYMWKNLLK